MISKKFKRLFFSQSFRLLGLVKSLSARQRRAGRRCRIFSNVAYQSEGSPAADSPAHLLDVYQPRNTSRPRPVILYLHGGGFTMCSKDTHHGIGLVYADNGYLVFNANYRLSPKHPYPAALMDVANALLWAKKHAAAYGGDPDRMIIAGESAGGNLTLALAAAACFPLNDPVADLIRAAGAFPQCIMVMCGMLQVSDPRHLNSACPPINPAFRKFSLSIAEDVSRAYMGPGYENADPRRILADPIVILESAMEPDYPFPVTYAMAGAHDILLSHTRRLENALNRRKIRNHTRYFPGQGHAFHLLGISPQAGLFWKDNLAFLHQETRRLSSSAD